MRRLLLPAALGMVLSLGLLGLVSGEGTDAPAKALSRIAFGSCANQYRPQPIWDSIVAERPELFVFLGDNVYADTRDMAFMRAQYAKLAAMPGYGRLKATCPILATWDDHDYGENDAGAEYPMKEESRRIFFEFFGVPEGSPRRAHAGIYDAQVFGPPGKRVQVILLDTRSFRGPLHKKDPLPPRPAGPYDATPDSDATVLGAEQWRWLEGELRVPAELRLIASSIQVAHEDHGCEKWMNFPRERQRLFDLIASTGAHGVVFLSGDMHLGEIAVLDGGVGYPLYDVTSSGLNQGYPEWRRPDPHRHRVGTMTSGDNFGLVRIDWEAADPRVSLQVRAADGEVAIQQRLLLSDLRPRKKD